MAAFLRGVPARWKEGILAGGLALALWAALVPGDTVVNVAFAVPVTARGSGGEGRRRGDMEPRRDRRPREEE